MKAFKYFKYYTALRLHFTQSKFDVFKNKGRMKGSYESFLMRNDFKLFEKLSNQFSTDKEFIQYIASNFMYGNFNVIYNQDDGIENYKEYIKRKQSITRVFTNDLDTIINTNSKYNFTSSQIPDIIQLLMSNRITIETMVILNGLDDIVNKMRKNNQLTLLLNEVLLRIEKSKNFVKYDSYKIMNAYQSFLEEIESTQDSKSSNNCLEMVEYQHC